MLLLLDANRPFGATQEHRHEAQKRHYQHRNHHRQQWHSQHPNLTVAQTKHNREEHLDVATIERAVHSVGAAVVMFYAQFGIGITIGEDKSNLLRNVFTLDVDPLRYPQDCYIPVPPVAGRGWEWDLIDYPF